MEETAKTQKLVKQLCQIWNKQHNQKFGLLAEQGIHLQPTQDHAARRRHQNLACTALISSPHVVIEHCRCPQNLVPLGDCDETERPNVLAIGKPAWKPNEYDAFRAQRASLAIYTTLFTVDSMLVTCKNWQKPGEPLSSGMVRHP